VPIHGFGILYVPPPDSSNGPTQYYNSSSDRWCPIMPSVWSCPWTGHLQRLGYIKYATVIMDMNHHDIIAHQHGFTLVIIIKSGYRSPPTIDRRLGTEGKAVNATTMPQVIAALNNVRRDKDDDPVTQQWSCHFDSIDHMCGITNGSTMTAIQPIKWKCIELPNNIVALY
jgi:hypothetical protein